MRRTSLGCSDASQSVGEAKSLDADDMNDVSLALPPSEQDGTPDPEDRPYTQARRASDRFYRPSAARRKESAASSRRNSLSSAHSRCSSVQHASSLLPEDQSKYVAQHLRRASFLEDRRARLADRAAHAEKVRLRAALAKATPRGPLVSEERALAAQQARERNLTEIVANCAEEVRKAKQVAELTKEKREQEVAQMKARIDERMAEAEKRLGELRSKGPATVRARGQSLTARKPVEVLPEVQEGDAPRLSEDVAASTIQGWWLACKRRRVINNFNSLGLSVESIQAISFDNVVALLGQENVLLTTSRLLRICGLREGDPSSVEEMAAVRTFLSAFLILGHPNQVLSNKLDGDGDGAAFNPASATHRLPSTDLANPQLQALIGKAKDLLICFEGIVARLNPANRFTMPPTLQNALSETYAVFYNALIAWKSRDSNALVEVMLMQFVELDAIFQTVKKTTDDSASALYRKSIQDSQLMLIMRIKKLAGAERGKRMVFKAVSDARKARATKKQTGDTRPRVAENESAEASETASSIVSPEPQVPTPPLTPASKSGPPSPTSRIGLNGLLPDNRVVVHELAINREYQIPPEEYVSAQVILARPMYTQMRTAIAEDDGQAKFRFFMLMASNIKEKLQRLLKPGNSIHNLIGEILDPYLAERQFMLGNFSYKKFFASMGTILPKLCAPFRDEEVKSLVQNKLSDGNLIDRVEALNSFIDVMLCDYINYLLRIAAPQLIGSAAQYEAKRFASDVARVNLTLAVAELAWSTAASKVALDVQKRDPEGINHPKTQQPTASKIYAQMLVDVSTQPTPISHGHIPEMLWLDHARINGISIIVRRIIVVGAILLQCKNLLKRDVRTQWKTEANRIMTVLEADHASLDTTLEGIMAALEAGRSMPASTKTHLRALVSKVLTANQDMARPPSEPREPVLRLLLTRLRGNILARLMPGSASEKVKAANASGEKLASLGLSEFVERVRHIADLLEKIGAVDRAAHSDWWDVVAARVRLEDAAAPAEPAS